MVDRYGGANERAGRAAIPRRVLLVGTDQLAEDGPIAGLLRRHGRRVTAFASGDLALEAHLAEPFGMVIVERTRASAAAVELCRRIREAPSAWQPVVLAYAPGAEGDEVRALLAAGASDVLPPFEERELFEARLSLAERSLAALPEPAPPRSSDQAVDMAGPRLATALRHSSVPAALLRITDGRIVEVNESFLAAFGYRNGWVLQRTSLEFGLWCEPECRERLLVAVRAGRSVRDLPVRLRTRSGSVRDVLACAERMRVGDEDCALLQLHDDTDRRRAERRQAVQLAVARVLADSATVDEMLGRLGAAVCDGLGWDLAEAWRLDERDRHLHWWIGWAREPERCAALFARGRAHPVPVDESLLGRVVLREVPRWIEDLCEERELSRAEEVLQAGLRSALGVPVRAAGRTVGVMVFCSREPHPPDASLLEVMDDVMERVARFIPRVDAVEALRRSEAHVRALVDALPDPLFRIDRDGCILEFRPAPGFVPVVPPEQFLGRPMAEVFFHFPRIDMVLAVVERAIVERRVQEMELAFARTPGGAMEHYEMRVAPYGEDQVIAVVRDVTEQANANAALRASEESFRSLIEHAPVGVLVIRDGRVIYANRSVAASLGHEEPVDVVGGLVDELVHPDDRARGLLLRNPAEAGEPVGEIEVRLLRRDRMAIVFEISAIRVTFDGRPATVALCRDLTARRQLEVQLRHAQKLESVGRLAAGIAHEINTPIQFIGDNVAWFRSAFARLLDVGEAARRALVDGAPALAPDAIAAAIAEADLEYLRADLPKALDETLDGVARVTRIVQAMKAFAHPDLDGQQHPADLNQALEGTLTVARNEYKYVADVETRFGELPAVLCGLGDLNQVFLNLIVNAAHAVAEVMERTGERGRITVETAVEGEDAVVRISDTGGGIAEAIRPRIFEPFFTTKPVGKGTGQGLALARAIVVERHGGTLDFESELGRGTTFTIRLPIHGSQQRRGGLAA